ncbi:MAG: hypothetical protein IJX94_01540 [Clostridia bacterium]|nr:hypothetical protein [Clostridia bacterium]
MEIKITVERRRASVTQGEAVVLINGTPAATFGDTIEMVAPGEKYYGELIGNWASKTPDTQFILGLLAHPYEEIYKLCEKAHEIIEDEKKWEEAGAKVAPTPLEAIAQKHGWPMKIKARGEIAYLFGVQPLVDGLEDPIYRFPGGDSIVGRDEMIPYTGQEKKPAVTNYEKIASFSLDEMHEFLVSIYARLSTRGEILNLPCVHGLSYNETIKVWLESEATQE